ncbi:MAG: hypothetical protein OXC69_04380 [Candidatus Tectomicrobia bacterium]|nr:hypothetical protein [Candidatus Tectomicrobia bacterium]
MPEDLLHHFFSDRLTALKSLESGSADAMQAAANEIKLTSALFGNAHPARELNAFSEVLECLALAQRWVAAVRRAETEAVRFRDACRLRATEALEKRKNEEPATLDPVLAEMAEIQCLLAIDEFRRRVQQTPLPFGVWGDEWRGPISRRAENSCEPNSVEVVFVKFDINSLPAKDIDTLSPNTTHDIGIEIRVSRWPDSAHRLVLTPVSTEPPDTYELPTFSIKRQSGPGADGPYVFHEKGRLLLKVPVALGARPYEFVYRAVFEPASSEQPLNIFGQRTLRFESVDPSAHAISGYKEIDDKLRELRSELRHLPGIPDDDIGHALEVCASLGNLAGQALSDGLFPEGTDEKKFQREVVRALRGRPSIGEELDRHPQTGRGIVDLSFRRIRIELKAITKEGCSEAEIGKFVDQTAQYVVTSGKRIGVLCVLNSCKKTDPPSPAESYLRILRKRIGRAEAAIIFVRIEGGLARPSDLSR